MSQKNNKLELYIASLLQKIDKFARPTRGSGCGNEIGDISNKYFYIECKEKHTHENIIMQYKKEWKKLCSKIPVNTSKIPIVAIENMNKEKFIILNVEDFFNLIYKIYDK